MTTTIDQVKVSRLQISLPLAPVAFVGLASIICLVASTLLGASTLRLLSEMLIYLTLAQAWNLLAGYAGLVSVGQQAFVGIGGYAFFYASTRLGMHPFVGLALAGMAGLITAAVFSIFLFRLKGTYFAIGSWVLAEVALLTIAITPSLGGGSGMSLPASIAKIVGATKEAREATIFLLAAGLAVASIVAAYALLRSRFGLALMAVRDSERAAESLGVDAMRIRRGVYIGVGLVTGICGGIIFLMKLRMTPDAAFSVLDWTAYVLFIVIIGGIGRIEGPIIGTAVFFLIRWLFAGFGPLYLVLLGLVAVVAMVVAPRGVWGLVARRSKFEVFPVRRVFTSTTGP